MNNLRKAKALSLVISVLFFALSCSKNGEIEKINLISQEYYVNPQLAIDIASAVSFPKLKEEINNKTAEITTKTIKSLNEFRYNDEETSFYLFNYNEGGFVIISADKRTRPILGYSMDNNFMVDETSYPSGLKFWMDDTKKQINEIQHSNFEQSKLVKKVWDYLQNSNTSGLKSASNIPPEDCYDHDETYMKGPLLNTTWYQTGAFNDALPLKTCYGLPVQIHAGCVPIAMAQVMKYYGYPTTYNWAAMPLTYGTATTANFIKTIHDKIGELYLGQPYSDCDGTYVDASKDMSLVLRNKFSYSAANKADYNLSTVKSNIDNNRPVILRGDNGSSIGHMWVCDGYLIASYYFEDCTGISYLSLHMNWGWEYGSYNGWYAYDNFNPGNNNYNEYKTMIYNIIP